MANLGSKGNNIKYTAGTKPVLFLQESVNKTPEERSSHPFFDLDTLKASLRTAFRRRPDHGRARILLLVFNFAAFMFCLNTTHYDYLLVQLKFDWKIDDFSNYLTVQRLCRMFGLFVVLPVLSRFLKVSDAPISVFGTLVTFLAYFIIAVGKNGWVMYLSAALQLNSVITVVIR